MVNASAQPGAGLAHQTMIPSGANLEKNPPLSRSRSCQRNGWRMR